MSNNSEFIEEIARQISAGVRSFNEQSANTGSSARAIIPSHFEVDGTIFFIKETDDKRKLGL